MRPASSDLLPVALAFGVLTGILLWFERRRLRRLGADPLTLFVIIYALQCILPGAMIFASIPFVSGVAPTGTGFFDRVYRATTALDGWILLCFAAWFLLFFYVGSTTMRTLLRPRTSAGPGTELEILTGRLAALLACGTVFTLWSFYLLGDSVAARYTNLILLRADFDGIEKNAINSNALSLTQAWGWLAILASFSAPHRGRARRSLRAAAIVLAIFFAILGASRRALFIPLLLVYFTHLLHTGKWHLKWLAAGVVPMLLWVAYGKDVLASIAWGGSAETVTASLQTPAVTLLRASSEIGISFVESLGTLEFLHLDHRWGIDHLLSIAQRFPDGALGHEIDFPPRIVRLSTEAFAGASAQDIPPGIFGQMWLDFGVLGPVVWGLALGVQMGVLLHFFDRTRASVTSACVFAILTFVIALPLNSGSFDFTFSVDIFMLTAGLIWCIRRTRIAQPTSASGMRPSESA
jgi:hypothetical protein